jgi:profilin
MGDWQGYIDNSLIGSGEVASATILGLSDASYWAYGGDIVPQPDEAAHIIACLKTPSLAQEKGITIAGQKYFTIKAEPGLLYGKLGATGVCIASSMQAAVLGIYAEGTNPANCNMTVEGVATYLKSSQY